MVLKALPVLNTISIKDINRYWSKVQPIFSGCFIWTGKPNASGYGYFKIGNVNYSAHRLAWLFHTGLDPLGLSVLHHCDVRCCVRSSHLFLGNQKANVHDALSKQRHPIGTKNGRHKFTVEEVQIIRKQLQQGFGVRELGRMYGIAHTSILRIGQCKHWKILV